MELLDQLEKKITLALETIELLSMENEELKQELETLKQEKLSAVEQQKEIENKINLMLGHFDNESVNELMAANS